QKQAKQSGGKAPHSKKQSSFEWWSHSKPLQLKGTKYASCNAFRMTTPHSQNLNPFPDMILSVI
ncbi:MAG TPA: hypothetical protein VMG10_27265, partial [Gemmataceae bacterium]|nr:hypothetical protein [Gemmataceae bacterium]